MQTTLVQHQQIIHRETARSEYQSAFWRPILRFFRSVHRRRHLDSLARLSNSELADIGLTRGDLFESAALGLGEDVTTHLAAIAKNRRAPANRLLSCKT